MTKIPAPLWLRNIPAPLVIILMTAIVLPILAGLYLEFTPRGQQAPFLALRIKPDSTVQIDPKALPGTWIVQESDVSMALKMSDNLFEWQANRKGFNNSRFFARGSYRVEGDVLIMQQRDDMGAPYDERFPRLKWLPLAFEDINIRLTQSKNSVGLPTMIWTVPPSEESLTPHEFFILWRDGEIKTMTWVKNSNHYK